MRQRDPGLAMDPTPRICTELVRTIGHRTDFGDRILGGFACEGMPGHEYRRKSPQKEVLCEHTRALS
jgi:hypothetical protein